MPRRQGGSPARTGAVPDIKRRRLRLIASARALDPRVAAPAGIGRSTSHLHRPLRRPRRGDLGRSAAARSITLVQILIADTGHATTVRTEPRSHGPCLKRRRLRLIASARALDPRVAAPAASAAPPVTSTGPFAAPAAVTSAAAAAARSIHLGPNTHRQHRACPDGEDGAPHGALPKTSPAPVDRLGSTASCGTRGIGRSTCHSNGPFAAPAAATSAAAAAARSIHLGPNTHRQHRACPDGKDRAPLARGRVDPRPAGARANLQKKLDAARRAAITQCDGS